MPDTIQKTIDIDAPIERVWRAISDQEEFGQWFRVKLDQPFQPNSPSTGRMTVPGYEHVQWRADVVEMRAPDLLSFRWRPYAIDPDVDYSAEEPTLCEFRLEEIPGGTRLTVTESGFENVPAHRRAEAFRMNTHGWEAQVRNVKAHVEAG